MRPTDPRVRRQLGVARGDLTVVLGASLLASALVIAQAWVITGLVLAALHGTAVGGWAAAAACLLVARGAVGGLVDVAAARAAAVVSADLRTTALRASIRRRALGGDAGATGSEAVLVTRGVAASEPFLTRYVPAFVLASVVPIATVVAIATQDLPSALIVVLTLPLVPVFGALVGLATRDRAQEQWRAMGALSGHFVDVVRGLPTLVAFRRGPAQSRRIRAITDRYRRASMATLRIAFLSSTVLELVATLSVALVAVTVGIRLAGGHVGLHTALVVLLLAPEAYWPLRRLGAEFHASAEGAETFGAVADLADAAIDAGRTPDPAQDLPARGPLSVSGLAVVRPGRVLPALEVATATLPDRGVTAVVGPSGCGKSTLLEVLAGRLAPSSGSITLGGVPVGGDAWRARVAHLPQRPVFVAGSIADNLRLARPGATDAELWDVLARVALEERVRDLGLDAPVAQDGAALSAGERARLALARVVLADRPWVLLDEPTAHLDPLTERIIADTVVELGRDHAVVVVAHQPALVGIADHVLTLTAPAGGEPEPERRRAAGARAAVDATDESSVPEVAVARRLTLSAALGGLASISGVALTATAGWLIVQASARPPVLTLLVAVVAVRAFGLARPVLRYAERVTSHDVALRLLADRRVEVYDALVPLTPGALGRRRGDLLAGVVDDVDSVVDRELRVRLPLRGYALVVLAAGATAAVVLPVAGLVVALAAALFPAAGYVTARLAAGRAEEAAVADRAELSSRVVESLDAAAELVGWGRTVRAEERVADVSRRLGREARVSAAGLALGRGVVLAGTGLAMAAVALLGSAAHADGRLSGPLLALLVLLPLAVGEAAAGVPDAGALAARTAAARRRLDELTARAPRVTDPVSPEAAPVRSDLALHDVAASWGTAPVVTGLGLWLSPGERVALVGPSGSGKSTVAAVALRFLDPLEGVALLGGTGLRGLLLDDVRERIGLVDDDPHLFATTLAENVRLARPGAGDDEVEAALRQACLGPWVDALPDGIHTWLGDGHAEVSGGERARIAIARCLLADQPVVVLDEPVAHLDHATAEAVAAEVLAADTGRGVLWITHSPVGLDRVDKVVRLGEPVDALATSATVVP